MLLLPPTHRLSSRPVLHLGIETQQQFVTNSKTTASTPVGGAAVTTRSAMGRVANTGAGKAPRGREPRFHALE